MASACWDPANLLQITLDMNDTYGEIQCVGQAQSRHNNRCRWTIEDPDRSKVRPLLTQMSTKRPESVTTETLRQLATFCLCPSYHSRQVEAVVLRWATVIKRAAQHHKSLLDTLGPAPHEFDSHISSTLREAQQQITELQNRATSLEKQLQAQTSAAAESLKEAEKHKSQLRDEICSWKNQLKESEDINMSHELVIRDIQLSNQALTGKMNDASKDTEKHENDIEALQERLEDASGRLEACQREKDQALRKIEAFGHDLTRARKEQQLSAATNETLQKEYNAVEQTKTRLQAELETRDSSLRQSQANLEQSRRRISTLEVGITNLQISEKNLKASISACWMHGFCLWTANMRKSSSSKGPEEEAPGHNV